MSKLYILSLPLTSHADILTRDDLSFVKSFLDDYCKANPPIYAKTSIIYIVDSESIAGTYAMCIVAYCERHEITHTFKVVTI
jgi:hypothetical protein